MHQHKNRLHHKVFLFFLSILIITGCNTNIAAEPPLDRWASAAIRGNVAAVEELMRNEDFAVWRTETELLNEQHQGLQSYERIDLAEGQPGTPTITATKWTWTDDFTRCLRVQVNQNNTIDLLTNSYEDCSQVLP